MNWRLVKVDKIKKKKVISSNVDLASVISQKIEHDNEKSDIKNKNLQKHA